MDNCIKINSREHTAEKDLSHLIDSIVRSEEFWIVNYYLRSMKKAPHGGVFTVDRPNMFLKYYEFRPFTVVCRNPKEIPEFMREMVEYALKLYRGCDCVDYEELLQYCFSGDNCYLGVRLLQVKPEHKKTVREIGSLLFEVLDAHERITDYFNIEPEYALYALILVLAAENTVHICNIEEIKEHEKLREPHNKYGLSALTDVEFLRQGFRTGNTYYLYNIFVDTTIMPEAHVMPYTFKVISEEITGKTVFMRCDENLAVPAGKMFSTASVDCQKVHGPTVNFADIKSVLRKEVIVHIHPELGHKVIMVVKPDKESGNIFYHIEVEQLWAPNMIEDEFVMTAFIHAKYFPGKDAFTHIDFSINQYKKDVYTAKYNDAVNRTGIPVDKYADIHYKIWCVEADNIKVETWSKLVCAALDAPFRETYAEMFKN